MHRVGVEPTTSAAFEASSLYYLISKRAVAIERKIMAQIPSGLLEIIIVAVLYTQQRAHLTLMVLLVFMPFLCRCLCIVVVVVVESCCPFISVCIHRFSNIDMYAKTVDSLLE